MPASRIPAWPRFEDLTLDPKGPPGNAWGLFGAENELGMLNLLTPETTKAAAQEIRDGTRISLDWNLDQPSIPSFGRQAFSHKITRKSPKWVTDDILEFNTQCSSQWDGLKHYAHQTEQLYYNGHTQDEVENTDVMGIDKIVSNGGIVGRGVLLDYADWARRNSVHINAFESVPILFATLKEIIAEHQISFRPGDILFIRTGYSAAYNRLSVSEQNHIGTRPSSDYIGLEATREVLEWIWANKFAAVASDNPSFERAPVMGPHHDPDNILHEWLLAKWGMLIGELFNLEELAEKCREEQRWTFFLSSVPLKVKGGVASPPNAVAIF